MRAPDQTHLIDTDTKLVQLLRDLGNERPLRRLLHLYFQTYGRIEVQQFDKWPDREITEEERERNRPSRTATRLLVYGFKGKNRRSLASIMLRPRDETQAPRVGAAYASVQEALDPDRIFLKCSTRSRVQWLGRPRKKSRPSKIICFPFIQKHREESWMCAHAAVRMVGEWLRQTNHFICRGLERKHWTFPAIDRAAGKIFPHNGLNAAEMKEVIEKMGFTVLDHDYEETPRPNYPSDSIVYSYVESGIPVLVLFGIHTKDQQDGMVGHVIAVVGHTFERHAWWPEAERRYYAKEELCRASENRGSQVLRMWATRGIREVPTIGDLVWITEFTTPDMFASGSGVLGHIVVDARAQVDSAADFSKALQYAHLPGGFHLWSSADGKSWLLKHPQEGLSSCLTWRPREVSPTR